TLVGGTLGPDGPTTAAPGVVVSLPPVSAGTPRDSILASGSLPKSDTATEIVITAEEAKRLGWSPSDAIGKRLRFTGQFAQPPGPGLQAAAKPQQLVFTVAGVATGAPAGDPTWSLVPYETANQFYN